MQPRVKICGNRSPGDALAACRAGADAIGVIVGAIHRSEDEVPVAEAARIFAALPPLVTRVLVTHQHAASAILSFCRRVPCDAVQLHGKIELDEVSAVRAAFPHLALLAAVHVTGSEAEAEAARLAPHVDGLVLDSRTADRVGGTGQVHDWSISRRIVSKLDVPVLLAGGLTPENVRQAIERVGPYAVDVNSGVKDTRGAKDAGRVRDFILAAQRSGLDQDPPESRR